MSEKELRRNHEDYRELLERATKDKLSDLLTRATAESYIEERLSLMRPDESCAVMIIDLDDFKLVNDTYGHQSGDEVIIHTARALSGSFRTDDIVSRWGGDEFLVFLSGSLNSDIVHNKAALRSLHPSVFILKQPDRETSGKCSARQMKHCIQ